MLSPHEFVSLILLQGDAGSGRPNPVDLDALLEYQLVAFEMPTSGCRWLNLRDPGYFLLRAAARRT
jgi:hypothetical protein